jgi:uncharacterized protein
MGRVLAALTTFLFLTSGLMPVLADKPPTNPIVSAARAQIGRTIHYDPAYVRLKYPNGDVSEERGVCTDVVIRALRKSRALDLQELLHEDMKANFSSYPKIWGLKKSDKNIDHRRVPNLQTFFKRKGWLLPVSQQSKDYLPGDLVTSLLPGNLPHIMIVSDRKSRSGRPLVIHNVGSGAKEEDFLFESKITGHYRLPKGEFNTTLPKPSSR